MLRSKPIIHRSGIVTVINKYPYFLFPLISRQQLPNKETTVEADEMTHQG